MFADQQSKPARATVSCAEGEQLAPDAKQPAADFAFVLAHSKIVAPKMNRSKRLRASGRVATTDGALAKWLSQPGKKPSLRRSLDMRIDKSPKSPERRFVLRDCFPVRFTPGDYSPDSTTQLADLDVHVGRVELQ